MEEFDRSATLVGRRDELARAREAVRLARTGSPRVLVLAGEPGIGKSRLAAEILSDEQMHTSSVLRGGGIDLPGLPELRPPFGMFVEAMRWALDDAPDSCRQQIQEWIDPRPAPHAVEPLHFRHEQLLMIIRSLSEHHPVVLLLEDLHWADDSSLAALVFLSRHLTRERVAIILTTRPPSAAAPVHGEVAEHLRRLPGVEWIEVPPLSPPELCDVVRRLGEQNEERLLSLVTLAEGNVLAALQIASASGSGDDFEVPLTVDAAVSKVWNDASQEVRRLLSVCAVIDRDVEFPVLQAVMSTLDTVLPDQLDQAIAAARATGLVQTVRTGVRFRHELERRWILDRVPTSLTMRLHPAIARILEGADAGSLGGAGHLAKIAGHWSASADRVASARACLAAGLADSALSAFPEALQHFEHGLRDLQRLSQVPAGISDRMDEVVSCAAAAARWTGQLPRGLTLLRSMVPMLLGDALTLAWERIGWLEREVGNAAAAREAYSHALSRNASPRVRAKALAGSAAFEMTSFNLDAARSLCLAGLDVCGEQEWPERANLLCTYGVVLALDGEVDRGLELLSDSLLIAERGGSDEDVFRYLGNASYVLQNADRPGEAVDIALQGIDRARSASILQSATVMPVVGNALCGLVALGRWDEALDLAGQVSQRATAGGPAVAVVLLAEAEIRVLRGEFSAANDLLSRTETMISGWQVPSLLGHVLRVRAESAAWRGDLAAALTYVERGVVATRGQSLETMLQLCRTGARATADLGRRRERRSTAAPTNQFERAFHDAVPGMDEVEGRADRCGYRAEMARAVGAGSPEMWTETAAAWQDVGDPFQEAYARFRLAEVLLARGRRETAQVELNQSLVLVAPLDAIPLMTAITALAKRTRLRTDLPSPGLMSAPKALRHGLTRREVDVLAQLAEGLTNRQIARLFSISERTVGVHVSNVLSKLGVSSRSEAAAMSYQQHLLDDVVH